MSSEPDQEAQLKEIYAKFESTVPEPLRKPLTESLTTFKTTFDPKSTIQPGSQLPAFTVPDATGKPVSSANLLSKGPLLITFYRGEWCPYCNIAVAFLQKHLGDFAARGVTLVAISPELPNNNMTMTEKHELKFPVLTDLHNEVARRMGLVYDQSSARELHRSYGIDLKVRNDDQGETWEVPIPATLLVDQGGVVRKVWVDPNYTKRLDPKVALEWVDALKK